MSQHTQSIDLSLLSKHELEELQHACRKELQKRFIRRKKRKYGTMFKAFRPEELRIFFSHVGNEYALLSYMNMAYAGLRVSEAVRIRAEHVDLSANVLSVQSLKTGLADEVPLCPALVAQLERALERTPTGYLTPGKSHGHLSADWLRNYFREVVNKAGLDQTYGESEERGRKPRKLHRLTTHSLRHYFVTMVYNSCKNQKVAQRLARHTSMASTGGYIHASEEELSTTVLNAF